MHARASLSMIARRVEENWTNEHREIACKSREWSMRIAKMTEKYARVTCDALRLRFIF